MKGTISTIRFILAEYLFNNYNLDATKTDKTTTIHFIHKKRKWRFSQVLHIDEAGNLATTGHGFIHSIALQAVCLYLITHDPTSAEKYAVLVKNEKRKNFIDSFLAETKKGA